MINELVRIGDFIVKSLIHVWPYLVVTIPIAVAIRMSGFSKHIAKGFGKRPFVSIILSTLVGAVSPFCSCSVIPVIASLLIGGVPLAPVMSFWLASPSMDPEMFFLSVTMIGWKLAIWRLGATFMMSLLAGFITHFLVTKKWITENATLKAELYSCNNKRSCSKNESEKESVNSNFTTKLAKEICSASFMVLKFMCLAYFLEALIVLYVPSKWITLFLGTNQIFSIIGAALIGIPVYTSNMPALALIGGLLTKGLTPAAGLAFLISGPTTTIPAMAAVWKLANRKVFFLYVGFTLTGAIISGLLMYITS